MRENKINNGSKNPTKRRLAKGNRYTADERQRLFREFSNALEAGHTTEWAARRTNVSPATFFRWRRARATAESSPSSVPSAGVGTSLRSNIALVERAIADLTACETTASERRRAVFLFSLWLNNPANTLAMRGSLPYFVMAYWNAKFPGRCIADLPIEARNEVNSLLHLEDCLLAYDVEIDIGMHGEEFAIHSESFTIRDVMAEWAWYFMASAAENFPATKETLQNAIFHKSLKYSFYISPKSINKEWMNRRQTLPFLYIESYSPSLNWSLNPKQEDFHLRVDRICDDLVGRRNYFGRCRWATEIFRRSYRTNKTAYFPTFPESIDAISSELEPLTDAIKLASRQLRYEETEQSLDHKIWLENAKSTGVFNRLSKE